MLPVPLIGELSRKVFFVAPLLSLISIFNVLPPLIAIGLLMPAVRNEPYCNVPPPVPTVIVAPVPKLFADEVLLMISVPPLSVTPLLAAIEPVNVVVNVL